MYAQDAVRQINLTLSLAFLAPALVKAAAATFKHRDRICLRRMGRKRRCSMCPATALSSFRRIARDEAKPFGRNSICHTSCISVPSAKSAKEPTHEKTGYFGASPYLGGTIGIGPASDG